MEIILYMIIITIIILYANSTLKYIFNLILDLIRFIAEPNNSNLIIKGSLVIVLIYCIKIIQKKSFFGFTKDILRLFV